MNNTLQPILGICGPSGSGKSSSLENLPTGTKIFDFERKGLPYDSKAKGHEVIPIGESLDSNGKLTYTAYTTFKRTFQESLKSNPPVIVLEGFLKLTQFIHSFADASYKGFDTFKYFNKWTRETLEFVKNTTCPIVITGINELVTAESVDGEGEKTDKVINCFAVATGKEMRGKLEQDMLIVLFTHVKVNKDKPNEHFFVTQTDGVNTAKSPAWMKLPKMVPNDLGPIMNKIKETYK